MLSRDFPNFFRPTKMFHLSLTCYQRCDFRPAFRVHFCHRPRWSLLAKQQNTRLFCPSCPSSSSHCCPLGGTEAWALLSGLSEPRWKVVSEGRSHQSEGAPALLCVLHFGSGAGVYQKCVVETFCNHGAQCAAMRGQCALSSVV